MTAYPNANRLVWERDGRDWPNRESSRFVHAGGLEWHVQVAGSQDHAPANESVGQAGRPVMLLVHGTGASTHSWRALLPLLAAHFTVVAPDLPGHGFTGTPSSASGFTLPAVARALAALLDVLRVRPVLAAGHSAGAAVIVRMALDSLITPAAVVSLNGALLPFPGMANDFFGPAARMLAGSGLAARAFALLAGAGPPVQRMLRSTGSRIDPEGRRLYARLAGNPVHVGGALKLMANWDLRPLMHDLPRLAAHLVLVCGTADGMVPPSESYRARALLPRAELISLRGLGHLAHEERPADIAQLLRRLASREHAGPEGKGPEGKGPEGRGPDGAGPESARREAAARAGARHAGTGRVGTGHAGTRHEVARHDAAG